MKRRDVIKAIGLGALATTFSGCSSLLKSGAKKVEDQYLDNFLRDNGPIDRSLGDIKKHIYSGDNPERTHGILWNKAGYITQAGGLPQAKEKTKIVIIGGGMSGLFSAYLLRKYKPILLERAERLGGNAKGESWQGSEYSLGAAYFMAQPDDSELTKIYNEIGVFNVARLKEVEDPVIVNGKRYTKFWEGESAPKSKNQFIKLKEYFEDVYFEKNGHKFPTIPANSEAQVQLLTALDQEDLITHLQKVTGEVLHPHVITALEHYCWSTFGSSATEVNAAVGLNAFTAEFGKTYVAPGGNSGIAELLLKATLKQVPASNMRTNSVVVEVSASESGVQVSYDDANGKTRTIQADVAIMACPKFVVKHILKDIEPERLGAIMEMSYRSYLVGNVLLNKKVPDDFYDLYMLSDGKISRKNFKDTVVKHGVTDVVYGNYAKVQSQRSILSLYKGFPYDGARAELLAPSSYERFHQEFMQEIKTKILPLLKVKSSDLVDLRLSRWGHPMPVPKKGFVSSGLVNKIRQPFKERVFFIEQDNWLAPAIETCGYEAIHFASKIKNMI